MAVVTIYSQGNLQYVVLPSREVLSKYPDDVALSIHKAEQSSFWRDKRMKQVIQLEGTEFFEHHADKLDTAFSMEDSNGKMSEGFFLYLAFRRFQNQKVQAYFINDDEVENLLKPDSTVKKSDDFAKLLTLETAIEYLVKAREYVEDKGDAPEGVEVQTGARGGLFYDPDQVKDKEQREEMPSGTREVDVVQAPALEEDDDDADDELVEAAIGGADFIKKMEGKGFFAIDEYLGFLAKEITVAEKRELISNEAIKNRFPATELVPIEPNLKIVNDDGVVTQITTTDGQIVAIQKIDFSPDNIDEAGKLIKGTGKANLFINPEVPDDGPDSKDNYIQYSYQDKDGKQKSGYSIKYAASSDAAKFIKVKKLAKKISAIKKACKADFNNPSVRSYEVVSKGKVVKRNMRASTVKEAALALALVNDTARRIGGVSGRSVVLADGKEGRPKKLNKDGKPIRMSVPTYGVTTLEARHIKVRGGQVSLEFIGKSGKTNYVKVTDKMVAKELAVRKKDAGKKGNTPIFMATASTVNNYFKSVAGKEFSVKNFRTYQGTTTAAKTLEGIKDIPSHFGEYPMIRYKTKDKIPIEVKSTWGAEFNKYMNTQINNGSIDDDDTYKRMGLLWLLKSQYESKRDFVGRPVSENLSNEPMVALAKYINPEVFDQAGWNDSFHLEQEEFLAGNVPEDLADNIKVAQAKIAARKNK